ncbi:MAG: hypothetical protein M0Z55_13730 [Peptococcaceae bacterium]|nr:hypothetical protein [Peptococcaceae bacterium]
MNAQLILLIILFCSVLIKVFWQAAYENDWTPQKVRKFYAYIGLNVLIPLFVLYLYTQYTGYEAALSNDTPALNPGYTIYLDLITFTASYLLTILALYLSIKTWPFATLQAASFKTLLAVVIIIFIVEFIANFKLPTPLPNGSLV